MESISITSNLVSNSSVQTSKVNSYLGLLNSDYKNIVKANFKNFKSSSLYSIKQRVKSNQFQTCCFLGTSLKVLIFFVATIIGFI